jgi:putative transposase
MPRKNLIRTADYFYHITTRSNDREWFNIPLKDVWRISILAFQKAIKNNPVVVSQYVLMANHYHMLVRTPNSDIDQFMYFFNKNFSDKLRLQSKKENRMFGSSYKWSLITHVKHFENVFRYIYQNPLRAGLVRNCENYPYSTFFYTSRGLKIPFKFYPLSHFESKNDLMNEPFTMEKQQAIKKGLLKTKYKEVYLRSY